MKEIIITSAFKENAALWDTTKIFEEVNYRKIKKFKEWVSEFEFQLMPSFQQNPTEKVGVSFRKSRGWTGDGVGTYATQRMSNGLVLWIQNIVRVAPEHDVRDEHLKQYSCLLTYVHTTCDRWIYTCYGPGHRNEQSTVIVHACLSCYGVKTYLQCVCED